MSGSNSAFFSFYFPSVTTEEKQCCHVFRTGFLAQLGAGAYQAVQTPMRCWFPFCRAGEGIEAVAQENDGAEQISVLLQTEQSV